MCMFDIEIAAKQDCGHPRHAWPVQNASQGMPCARCNSLGPFEHSKQHRARRIGPYQGAGPSSLSVFKGRTRGNDLRKVRPLFRVSVRLTVMRSNILLFSWKPVVGITIVPHAAQIGGGLRDPSRVAPRLEAIAVAVFRGFSLAEILC